MTDEKLIRELSRTDVTATERLSALREVKRKIESGDIKRERDKEAAKKVGQMVAKRALEKKIESVVFDRGGYIFHGRVKELAEGAREGGLVF